MDATWGNLDFSYAYELSLLFSSPISCQNFDFNELQKSTEYDGGYTTKTAVIEWFWDIVNNMPSSDQKQFLQFTTGSPRAPVGGLSHLKLVIARQGPDSDR